MDPGQLVPVNTRRDDHRIFLIKTNIPHSGIWVNEVLQKIHKKILSLAVQVHIGAPEGPILVQCIPCTLYLNC